jgi:DNA-directed RNA polymerase specialized sigma24 family protein
MHGGGRAPPVFEGETMRETADFDAFYASTSRRVLGQVFMMTGSRAEAEDAVAEDGWVALFAHANSRFVTAEAAGSQPLIANRTAIGSWEQFMGPVA